MESLHKAPQQLAWVDLGKWQYELRYDKRLFASMQWRKLSGSLASGKTRDGQWTFKRNGFFRPYLTVRAEGSERDLMTLRKAGREEIAVGSTGGIYYWGKSGRRKKEYAFFDKKRNLIAAFTFERKMFKRSGGVFLGAAASRCADLGMLILLGWHRLMLAAIDEESSAGAVIVAMG